jgi:flagellar protein FliO/FliZ
MSRLFAAPAAAAHAPQTGAGGLLSVTLALLAVLAAIFALAWLTRRVRTFGNRAAGALEVLANLPLGPKERAVLLKVGAAQILLGVAPGRVTALHVLEQPIEVGKPAAPAAEPARPGFSQLLKRSLGK